MNVDTKKLAKKIEVRSGTRLYNAINRLIDEQGKAPCLFYCTKGQPYLWEYWFDGDNGRGYNYETSFSKDEYKEDGEILNGKIIAEFEASAEVIIINGFSMCLTKTLNAFELEERSCLYQGKMFDYLGGKDGTAIHVHNLKPFDRPKELKEFKHEVKDKGYGQCEFCPHYNKCCKNGSDGSEFSCPKTFKVPLERAPQSYCFCEVDE